MKKKSDYLVGSHVVPPPAEYIYNIYGRFAFERPKKRYLYILSCGFIHTPKPSKPILIFETQMTAPSPLFI